MKNKTGKARAMPIKKKHEAYTFYSMSSVVLAARVSWYVCVNHQNLCESQIYTSQRRRMAGAKKLNLGPYLLCPVDPTPSACLLNCFLSLQSYAFSEKSFSSESFLSSQVYCLQFEACATMALPQPKLELRPLGNTGLKLSCVGFGASPLGNVFGAVTEEDANASVREAFRMGINFFDTSPYAFSIRFPMLDFC